MRGLDLMDDHQGIIAGGPPFPCRAPLRLPLRFRVGDRLTTSTGMPGADPGRGGDHASRFPMSRPNHRPSRVSRQIGQELQEIAKTGHRLFEVGAHPRTRAFDFRNGESALYGDIPCQFMQ